jgi:hypothetical protein
MNTFESRDVVSLVRAQLTRIRVRSSKISGDCPTRAKHASRVDFTCVNDNVVVVCNARG